MQRAISLCFSALFLHTGCDDGERHSGLLSPGSTSGALSEGRASVAHCDDLAEPWALTESTPGGPPLEYTLDASPPPASRQHSGARSSQGIENPCASRSPADGSGTPGPGESACNETLTSFIDECSMCCSMCDSHLTLKQ